MKWVNFLHFYQPYGQKKLVLEAVVNQCYLPVFKGILEANEPNVTVNISGVLLEMLKDAGYRDLLKIIGSCVESGKVELTGSCKYHALAPLLTTSELVRQVRSNEETLCSMFGKNSRPVGFFPPEMAFTQELARAIFDLGYKWVILDEVAKKDGFIDGCTDNMYRIRGAQLDVLFRVRRVSNLVMSSVAGNLDDLKGAIKQELASGGYLVTGMDGETFGHHRVGYEKLLIQLLKSAETLGIEFLKGSDLVKQYDNKKKTVDILSSTWATSPEDIRNEKQYITWKDRNNDVHTLQHVLIDYVRTVLDTKENEGTDVEETRKRMDKALSSDHLFWGSGNPWWSIEMIEQGAGLLLSVLDGIKTITADEIKYAQELYIKIIAKAFEWQKTDTIQGLGSKGGTVRIPLKDSTVGIGGAEKGVYDAFIDMIKDQEKLAVVNGFYEKAILWRDALFKLKHRLDIYETISAIDLLRLEISNKVVEKTIRKYKDRYLQIRGGQPEQRDSQ
jgi:hypothetical protein